MAVAAAVAAFLASLAASGASGSRPPATAQCQKQSIVESSCMLSAPTSYSYEDDNATSCCLQCEATVGCRAWSVIHHDRAGGPWEGQSHCLIYSRAASFQPGNCTSGIMRPTPPLPRIRQAPKGARNVLMLIVDDLRPQLGVYGQHGMITPNMDRLGANGVVFNRAYCQIAICGPSRNSFLTGRRPQNTQVWNFRDSFRETHPDWVAFPEFFKLYNYTTLGAGKTYHPKSPPYSDEPASWTQEEGYYGGAFAWPPRPGGGGKDGDIDPLTTVADNPPTPEEDCLEWPGSFLCPRANVTDSYFRDWGSMNATRARIFKYASNKTRPFFLAYGAHRPHLPWSYPRRFWDMYSETESIALPKYEAAPQKMPKVAFTYEMDGMLTADALNHTEVLPWPSAETAFSHNMTRTLRRGYYGAVSWCDFLIGELLDAIALAGVANTTVVALVGDHGWQLGEHNLWGKHTNFELGTRVPFIVSAPGYIIPGVSHALVELVDLYPTIASVAGLPAPNDLDGIDLSPLLNRTSCAARKTALKMAVFSEYPRCFLNLTTPWDGYVRPAFGNRSNGWGNCMSTGKHWIRAMGLSVRTMEYRYTVWLPWDGVRLQADFDAQPIGEELYIHFGDDGTDFDMYENSNVVDDPGNSAVVKELFRMAKKQWDNTLAPPSPKCNAVHEGHVQRGMAFAGTAENSRPTHFPGTSVLDCCRQCEDDSNCSYFTFSTVGGMCRFHTRVLGQQRSAGAVSGALDGVPPAPPPIPPSPSPPTAPTRPPRPSSGCTFEAKARYNGTLQGYIPARSVEKCCTSCGQVDGCVAFTFAPELLRCALFSNVFAVVDDLEIISGNISAS